MKILLLGGTGAIGHSLFMLLAQDENVEVKITTRQKINDDLKGSYIQGNAKNTDFVEEVLKKDKYDIVVDFMLYTTSEFQERVEMLLQLSGHYVFLSSARVYAETKKLIDEETERLLDISKDKELFEVGEYALTKAAEEDILRRSKHTNWTIIRPYKTYDNNRMQIGVFEKEQWAYRALHGKKIVLQREIIDKHTSLTSSKDTAAVLRKILFSDRKSCRVFQIANPKAVTWSEVLDIYSDVLEKKTGKKLDTKLISCEDNVIEELFSNKFRIKYDGIVDKHFSDKSIQELFEGKFEWTDPSIGLANCFLEFLDNNKKDFIPDYCVEGYFDRLTKESEKIRSIPKVKDKVNYFIFRYMPIRPYFFIKKIRLFIKRS